ncbi:MAG: uroporphyrinogen decarboxylase family protein [Clostridia bacterium]|jgi:uroporphyrinogen-III decarboxylase|nr:uroporphyrinogen decarboxylase family protein [Clostridia bacterium]
MPVRDFFCSLHHNILTKEILAEHDNLLPQAYKKACPMFKLSRAIAKNTQSPIIMFPLDYMAEAEAMGYIVKGYDDNFGLRGAGPIVENTAELALLPAIDFSSGRIKQILKAIELAQTSIYVPCLSISGFVTVADTLLSLNRVCTSWRNQKNELFSFWQRYAEELLNYSKLAQKAGAKIISYSDPMAAASILGPKWSKEIVQEIVAPFLKKLLENTKSGVIHLCGKTSYVLEDAGLAKLKEIALPQTMGYQKAVTAQIQKKPVMLGHGCLNNNKQTKTLTEIIPL